MPELNHIIVMPIAETGHLRNILNLTLNLFKVHPSLIVTLLMTSACRKLLDRELELVSPEVLRQVESQERWRIVDVDDGLTDEERGKGVMVQINAMIKRVQPVLRSMIEGRASGGMENDRWAAQPCLIICDMFLVSIRDFVRPVCETSKKPMIPVVSFIESMAVALHRYVYTTEHHGIGQDIMARYEKNKADGTEESVAVRTAFRHVQNVRLEWPDLPAMFDYEWSPQSENRIFDMGTIHIWSNIYKSFREADGFICISVPEIDGASLDAIMQEVGIPMIGVGPQLVDDAWLPVDESLKGPKSEAEKPIVDFLDKALSTRGPNSVAYISSGTEFWPTLRPSLMEEIVDTLLEIKMPFVFATPCSKGKLDQALKDKVTKSGLGLVTDWEPQTRVLQHKATAVFLTHCGVGSITDAIISEMPILAMPFGADHAPFAAHFTQIQKIGITLDQMSANAGLQLGNGTIVVDSPEARRAELKQAFEIMRGVKGYEYRKRVVELKAIIKKSIESGGSRQGMVDVGRWFAHKGLKTIARR